MSVKYIERAENEKPSVRRCCRCNETVTFRREFVIRTRSQMLRDHSRADAEGDNLSVLSHEGCTDRGSIAIESDQARRL